MALVPRAAVTLIAAGPLALFLGVGTEYAGKGPRPAVGPGQVRSAVAASGVDKVWRSGW
ncbi:hypothetical protein JOJ86_004410 [Rhodococcus percolatus]|nr:hypothetical protein [Rhodococcus opacus]MBP2206684.1 hypothetical protein [Rhodococcus opacus]